MQTTVRVATTTRDSLARIAEEEMGGVSLDEALRVVLFQHETAVALRRLAADPEMADDYFREAQELAEVDVDVNE